MRLLGLPLARDKSSLAQWAEQSRRLAREHVNREERAPILLLVVGRKKARTHRDVQGCAQRCLAKVKEGHVSRIVRITEGRRQRRRPILRTEVLQYGADSIIRT